MTSRSTGSYLASQAASSPDAPGLAAAPAVETASAVAATFAAALAEPDLEMPDFRCMARMIPRNRREGKRKMRLRKYEISLPQAVLGLPGNDVGNGELRP